MTEPPRGAGSCGGADVKCIMVAALQAPSAWGAGALTQTILIPKKKGICCKGYHALDIQRQTIAGRGNQGRVHEDSASRLAVRDSVDVESGEWRKTRTWKGLPGGEAILGKDPEWSVRVHVTSGRRRRRV